MNSSWISLRTSAFKAKDILLFKKQSVVRLPYHYYFASRQVANLYQVGTADGNVECSPLFVLCSTHQQSSVYVVHIDGFAGGSLHHNLAILLVELDAGFCHIAYALLGYIDSVVDNHRIVQPYSVVQRQPDGVVLSQPQSVDDNGCVINPVVDNSRVVDVVVDIGCVVLPEVCCVVNIVVDNGCVVDVVVDIGCVVLPEVCRG